MVKSYVNQNVYDSAMERVKYLFDEFDNVLVAFSGGKDSSICLNICYDYAKEYGMLDKMAMYHMDYEAQYQFTTDYVTETFKSFPGIRKYWLCLPIAAQCCCNMSSGYWIPWEKEKQNIWVREMPDDVAVVNEDNVPFDFKQAQQDYLVQTNFSQWFSSVHGSTAVVIGIRASESLNRYRAIKSDRKVNTYKEKNYIVSTNKITHNSYIIYDWEVEDVWTANAKFGWNYNKLYDLYYQAGVSVDKMRVASPFNDCAAESLKLYKVIDPNMWGKMVSRVNGVNFTGIYGGTTAMGWKSITLPKGHTWKSYLEFLLSTLEEPVRENYIQKFTTSLQFWKEKGGVMDDVTIQELQENNDFDMHVREVGDKKKVTFEEYPDDADVTNFQMVPTYKRMCICILKNDYYCKYMGFAQTKDLVVKRKRAVEKYRNLL